MKGFKATIIFALIALTHGSAVHLWQQLIPPNQEFIYKYHALVEAGTHIPHSLYTSSFVLDGKLHMQTDSADGLLLRFSDLTFTMDNGRDDDKRETHMLPLPESMASLQNTFKVILQDNGKASGISMEDHEPESVINMKKAIGSIMQLDLENIKLNSVKPHAFITREKSLFGEDDALYNVLPHENMLTIQKMHEMRTSHHLYETIISNIKPSHCDQEYEDPLSHDSQKMYTIKRESGRNILMRIEANGGIYHQPYQGESVAMFIFSNQTLNMQEAIDKKDQMAVKSERRHENFENVLTNSPLEIVEQKDTLMPVVKQMLQDAVEYMDHDHMEMQRPDFKQGQLINRMQRVLTHFDSQMLKEMQNMLLSKSERKDLQMLDIFYDMLPLIGTRDSLTFIISLIKEKKVKDPLAMNMLKEMPLNVRQPSEQIIADADVLLHLTELSWPVQRMAVLSFSNLLNKLHEHKHEHFRDSILPDDHNIHHKQHRQMMLRETDIFDKYVNQFINKLKTSQKKEEKMLMMLALHNMKVEQVMRSLEPAVKGEWWDDNDLRLMAMWAVLPVAMQHPDEGFKMLWPIFTDRNLPTEMRAIALFMLTKTEQSLSRLINIFWVMQHEPNQDLYQFYYSFITTMSEIINPCSQRMRLFAKQLLKYTPRPYLHRLSGFHALEYYDRTFNFGNAMDMYMINTHDTQIFSLNMKSLTANINRQPNNIFVKVKGLGMALFENFKLNMMDKMKLFNCDEILKTIENIQNQQNVQIEITLLREQQVVEFMYFDSSNIKTMDLPLLQILLEEQFSYKKRYVDIHYETFVQVLLPTDIGFPATYSILHPSVNFGVINVTKTMQDKITMMHIDGKLQLWNHGIFGLAFHNPITIAWQGINRFISQNAIMPLDLDISMNRQQQTLTMSQRRSSSGFGINNHVTNIVFVKDYLNKDSLKKTSPHSDNWVVITHDDQFKSKPRTMNSFMVYDTDNAIVDRSNFVEDDVEYNAFSPLGEFMAINAHKMRYMLLQPDVATRGILQDTLGSRKDDTITDELTLRFNLEMNNEVSPILPAMKLNTRATFTTKTEGTPTEAWNVNAVLDINGGHTSNALKMQITKTVGENNFKMCIEGSETYTDDGITGHLDVARSSSPEGKCTKDETILNIEMNGRISQNIKRHSANYDVCHKEVHSDIRGIKPYSCFTALSAIRRYTLNIKDKLPNDIRLIIMKSMMTLLKEDMSSLKVIENKAKLEPHEYKVRLLYPMNEDVLDIEVDTREMSYRLSNLDRNRMEWLSLYPDNTQYSNINRIMHNLGLNLVCSVDGIQITDVKHNMKNAVSEDWKLILGDSLENTKHGVWVKMMHNKLALKIVHNVHILIIQPNKDKLTITLDGKTMEEGNSSQDWFHLDTMFDANMVAFISKHLGHHIVYNTQQVQMEIPKMDKKMVGLCFDKDN